MTKNIHIEKLDAGCIISMDGKRKTADNADAAKTRLVTEFKYLIDNLSNAQIKNMSVEITVTENPPQIRS